MSSSGVHHPADQEAPEGGCNARPNVSSDELDEILHALEAMKEGDFSVRLTKSGPGVFGKIADTFNDIVTNNQRMVERQVLLTREVDHRAKNSLAIVQSIIRLTRAKTIKSYIATVEGRIQSLSKVHSLLAQAGWQGADLHELVRSELAAYRVEGAERIGASGPKVAVGVSAAQTLALALHELATNAVKYGALSVADGRVSLVWETDATRLTLAWEETGGPAVATPVRKGLGLQMISASLNGHPDGSAAFDWLPSGLRCTLSLASEIRQTGIAESPVPATEASPVRRILLVEDEALVGMMVGSVLDELGYTVIGPCPTPAQAQAAIAKHDVDAAILDINLNGQSVYAVADALMASNIPFAFVTGYGCDAIEPRFARVPVLEKPVVLEQLRDLVKSLAASAPSREAPASLRA